MAVYYLYRLCSQIAFCNRTFNFKHSTCRRAIANPKKTHRFCFKRYTRNAIAEISVRLKINSETHQSFNKKAQACRQQFKIGKDVGPKLENDFGTLSRNDAVGDRFFMRFSR
jgi:hypothetical protein